MGTSANNYDDHISINNGGMSILSAHCKVNFSKSLFFASDILRSSTRMATTWAINNGSSPRYLLISRKKQFRNTEWQRRTWSTFSKTHLSTRKIHYTPIMFILSAAELVNQSTINDKMKKLQRLAQTAMFWITLNRPTDVRKNVQNTSVVR